MQLDYAEFSVQLIYESDFFSEVFPGYLLHSILGKQLHKLYCVNKSQTSCEKCLFNSTCGYSLLFETILQKSNTIVPGRNRGCHPFVIKIKEQSSKTLVFTLVLLGDFIKYYLPILEALKQAGETGIGKERIKFKVKSSAENIVKESFGLDLECNNKKKTNYSLTLKSPLRIVVKNHPLRNLVYSDFISAVNRRLRQIIMLYGEVSEKELEEKYFFSDIELYDAEIEYINLKRWSSRQQQIEPLGGLTGTFCLTGDFSLFEQKLLFGAELFGVGKNTNFGFGNIECMERKEE